MKGIENFELFRKEREVGAEMWRNNFLKSFLSGD